MTAPIPPALPPAANRPAMVVAGVLFIVFWGICHVVLIWFAFAGGFLLDILLEIFKTVTLPGLVINSRSPGMEMGWAIPLQIGVGLTGVAGIPAGLAFFWQGRRKLLWLIFAGLFVAGLAFDGYAIYRLFADSFRGLAGI